MLLLVFVEFMCWIINVWLEVDVFIICILDLKGNYGNFVEDGVFGVG